MNVGNYTFSFQPDEMDNLPDEIFYKCKKDVPFIHLDNFLTPEELYTLYTNAISTYENRVYCRIHDYTGGVEGSRVDLSGRYTINLPGKREDQQYLDNIVQTKLYNVMKDYFVIDGDIVRNEPWQFLGYGPGYFFTKHTDSCVSGLYSTDPVIRTWRWWCNTPARKFTVLIYLNSQDDHYASMNSYSGGDLILNSIYDANGHQVSFKPTAGSVICFPSNFLYMHEVKKITRGFRSSIVTWLNVV